MKIFNLFKEIIIANKSSLLQAVKSKKLFKFYQTKIKHTIENDQNFKKENLSDDELEAVNVLF